MFFRFHVLFVEFENNSFDFVSNLNFADIFFHRFGNIVIIQSKINITQDKLLQKLWGTFIKTVVALSKIENTNIENQSEAIIIYGHFLSSGFSIDPESIIGKSGKTHGAKIVKTHEKKEIISKNIICINL
jgi:hypothetical protein